MSSIPQNHSDEKALIDCVQRFFSKHHVGKLLARCNGMKEKGVSSVSLLRYKLSNIFVGRSMYMQQRTGSFKEEFSRNTFYRFLNSAKTNWLRFTSLLAADIVNRDIQDLTKEGILKLPLVLDAPFSNLSNENTNLVAEKLPAFAEQVIIFMLDKDWKASGLHKYALPEYCYRVSKEASANNSTIISNPGGEL